ncbi:MAG: tRNA pseudouridine(38-40) synthase TruA [Mycoplasmataceae bacterium]|nr:tRNA pseudouridine(38-40) synthase TruA [Mycoplasmataceae bacterium]
MRYLLWISYDGKNYYGWAKQPLVPTVSGTLEKATKEVFGKILQISSSSRTDRYVHALSLPVLLRGNYSMPMKEVKDKMNGILPKDIRINKIEIVDNDFQVRYHAKEKKYRYLVNLKGEGDKNYYGNHNWPFDLKKIKEYSKILIGKKNFSSFTGSEIYQTYIRTINSISFKLEGDILIFEIIGKGFMRFMVRNIIGSLLAHNRGAISDEEFQDLINHPEKGKSHYKAYGAGLYLVEVYY